MRGPSGEVRIGVSDLFEATAAEVDREVLGKIREQDDRRQHSYPHLESRHPGRLRIKAKKEDSE